MSNSVLWVLGILPGLCISVMVSWAAELCPELHCVPQHPQKGQWDEPRSISVVLNSSFTNWLCHCCFYFQITACSCRGTGRSRGCLLRSLRDAECGDRGGSSRSAGALGEQGEALRGRGRLRAPAPGTAGREPGAEGPEPAGHGTGSFTKAAPRG